MGELRRCGERCEFCIRGTGVAGRETTELGVSVSKYKDEPMAFYSKEIMYKPLPDIITIKDSGIHGLGLFTKEDIPKGTYLGMIHFKLYGEWIRTPLGAFGNHSDDPTCEKFWDSLENGAGWYLRTKRDVKVNEELTWKYTLYEIK